MRGDENVYDCKINLKKALIIFLPLILTLLLLNVSVCIATDVSATAALLVDGTEGTILYSKNPNIKLPPASTAKLVTAMVAIDNIDPDVVVTISKNAESVHSVEPKLRAGMRLSIRDLLYLALMRSVNGAAVAIAEAVAGSEGAFAAMMNQKVRQIGAMNTRFINASGLPGLNQYTTASDLVAIMMETLRYPFIEEIINTRVWLINLEGQSVLIKNTNNLLWMDDYQIGGKTGYTIKARHCFVGASNNGGRLFIVVLLGEQVRDKLWKDAKRLLEMGLMHSRKIADVHSHAGM